MAAVLAAILALIAAAVLRWPRVATTVTIAAEEGVEGGHFFILSFSEMSGRRWGTRNKLNLKALYRIRDALAVISIKFSGSVIVLKDILQ